MTQLISAARTALLAAAAALAVAGAAQASHLGSPRGLAVDRNGTLYVANAALDTVAEFSHGHSFLRNLTAGITVPTAVAVDWAGQVYVTNYGNNLITAYGPDGSQNTGAAISDPALAQPWAATIDGLGDLWVLDLAGVIHTYLPNGTPVGTFAGVANTTAFALSPIG